MYVCNISVEGASLGRVVVVAVVVVAPGQKVKSSWRAGSKKFGVVAVDSIKLMRGTSERPSVDVIGASSLANDGWPSSLRRRHISLALSPPYGPRCLPAVLQRAYGQGSSGTVSHHSSLTVAVPRALEDPDGSGRKDPCGVADDQLMR